MATQNDAVQSISGPDPDLQSARLAAISQSPDAQERNAPAEHPMVSYARGLLSPLNYPEAPFLNDQPTTSFGNTERSDMAQPYQPYTPGPFDFQGSNQGPAGQTGYDISKAVSEIPVVGGALNYLSNQIDPSRGARVTRSLMTNPSDEATQAEALGLISGGLSIEGQAGKAALSARLAKGAQGADQSGIAAKLAEASGGALTKDASRAASDAADAAAGRVPTADVSTQVAALKTGGASDQEIADFARTMAPAREKPLAASSGAELDPSRLTRAIQTAVGTEGTPLSQHPAFAPYGVRGSRGPLDIGGHGGDIGTATRAVMAGDPDAIRLLGPELSAKLIEGKSAQLVRDMKLVANDARPTVSELRDSLAGQHPAATVSHIVESERAAGNVQPPSLAGVPVFDYSKLAKTMHDAGVSDAEIAKYIGGPLPSAGTTAVPQTGGARPGELFPGIAGPGQDRIVTQADAQAAREEALRVGKELPPRSPSFPPNAPNARISEQPLFGPERMPGDVQQPRQPMLKSGLVPHMTEAVTDESGKVVTPPRPVYINGQKVMQVELGPQFGAGDATAGTFTQSAFPQQPIHATFNPKTGEFAVGPQDANALADQLRIEYPKDAPPKATVASAPEMASAVFRNYIVSNALSPFTIAIKTTSDLVKAVDTTLEAVTQGVRSGRPAEVPGSVKALYGGFWNGVTQDALVAFKNRQYALGAEGKTHLIDEMLSGRQGTAAKRFAQTGEVLSLGSPIPRLISSLTAVFQRGYRDMALYQEGYAQAASKGLSGQAADMYASHFMARPTEYIGGKAALERSTLEANTRTWTNSNPLSRIPGRDKPVIGDALFTITPFVNLVTNVAREGMEFIPGLGLAAKGAEAFAKGGLSSREWTRVAQHQFMGSVALVPLALKAAAGEVTGDGPNDDNKRFDLIQQGWKPNHIKIGNTWYPIVQFGPIAPILNSVGNVHDNLVYNTAAQDRDSVISKAGSALNGVVKGELDTAHWLDALLNLSSALNGSPSEQQQFVNQWLSLFVPQSGTLKSSERVLEPFTPSIAQNADLGEQIRERFYRQYPPALRPSDLQQMQPGIPRAESGAAAVLPILGSQGAGSNYDGVGVPEGASNYGTNTVLREAMRLGSLDNTWRKGGIISSPTPNIGTGESQIRLDPFSSQKYIQTIGDQRQKVVGALIASTKYQNATDNQKQTLFDDALKQADAYGRTLFLARGVVDATDPKLVLAQAVEGFHAQSSNKDRAYWVALLDRAHKLTPDVAKAIDALKEPLPDDPTPISVADYLKYAPLTHEYLAHVPFGTDAHPIGTSQDWAAVAAATKAKNHRTDDLIASGVNRTVADAQAQRETLAQMNSLVQRNLFLNGTQLENPARTLLARKYPYLSHFAANKAPTEAKDAYEQFPLAK